MSFKIVKLSLIGALITSLTACASVSEKIPTVKIERKKLKTVQTVQANYQSPAVQKAEAALVCDNENMRSRANDRNSKNDTARVLVLEEGGNSSNIIADVQVNCRDYFQSADYQNSVQPRYVPQPQYAPQPQASYTPAAYTAPQPQTQIVRQQVQVQAQAPKIEASTPIRQSGSSDGFLYNVRKGDTLYNIARINCTSVKHLAALNNLDDATLIDVDQVLHLPATRCNSGN